MVYEVLVFSIAPPTHVSSQVKAWVDKLNKKIDNQYKIAVMEGFVPHFTLYFNLFPPKNWAETIKAVRQTISDSKSFNTSLAGPYVERNYIWLKATKGKEEIEKLHKKIVLASNLFREGLVDEKYQGDISKYTKEDQENIKNYGRPYLMKTFEPHLTLGIHTDEEETKARAFVAKNQLQLGFEVNSIACHHQVADYSKPWIFIESIPLAAA